jgi:endonuclease/exonuclease/phosphatase (EEP) superfamily protein YafD
LGALCVACAFVGLLAPGASRLLGDGTLGWLADLAAHWVWLWLPVGAIGLVLAHGPWWARLMLGAAMFALPWAWLPAAMAQSNDAPQFRVVSANVHLLNTDPSPLLAWADPSKTDLIVVHELRAAFAQKLAAAVQWPHQHLVPHVGVSGIGLLSRWPLRDVREVVGAGGIPQLHALVETPQGTIEVIAVHPRLPMSPQWQHTRNQTLAALRPRGNAPALVIGDFNATPWSNAAPRLAQGGWRWFGGVQPTWPHSAWGIPIDAVWGHGAWAVTGHEVGPPIGSDHRPLRVGLRLTASLTARP